MKNTTTIYTIENARKAYIKADYAFEYTPKTINGNLIAFQHNGLLYQIYEGELKVVPCTPDEFALFSQSQMYRVNFNWLKFKD